MPVLPERPGPLFWTASLCLLALLALAFFVVCSLQVEREAMRHTDTRVRRLAFTDCLDEGVGSTIASCAREFGDTP
jgi:hypothetical protein